MEDTKVECCECGKKFSMVKPEYVFIPQLRCDSCLKKKKQEKWDKQK